MEGAEGRDANPRGGVPPVSRSELWLGVGSVTVGLGKAFPGSLFYRDW